MIGWFDEPEIKQIVNIPKSKRVALIVLIGYPGKETRKKIRKDSQDIICHNTYK